MFSILSNNPINEIKNDLRTIGKRNLKKRELSDIDVGLEGLFFTSKEDKVKQFIKVWDEYIFHNNEIFKDFEVRLDKKYNELMEDIKDFETKISKVNGVDLTTIVVKNCLHYTDLRLGLDATAILDDFAKKLLSIPVKTVYEDYMNTAEHIRKSISVEVKRAYIYQWDENNKRLTLHPSFVYTSGPNLYEDKNLEELGYDYNKLKTILEDMKVCIKNYKTLTDLAKSDFPNMERDYKNYVIKMIQEGHTKGKHIFNVHFGFLNIISPAYRDILNYSLFGYTHMAKTILEKVTIKV